MKAVYFVVCCLMVAGWARAEGNDPWQGALDRNGGHLDIGWGPDAFGYMAKDNLEPGGPTPLWTDISGYGVQVSGLDDDNAVGPFPIGFSFHYYWYDVHQFWVGSNGYIKFSSRGQWASPFPSIIPHAAEPNDVVAPLLDDWVFNSGLDSGRCYYWSNHSDTLIVMWQNVSHYEPPPVGSHDFEVILSARDSSITFQYGSQIVAADRASAGIENLTGCVGLTARSGSPVANTAIRFTYPQLVAYAAWDVALVAVQNPLSAGYFVLPYDTIRPWMQIANLGNQFAPACTLHTLIRRTDNWLSAQFPDTVIGPIPPMDTITISRGVFYVMPDSGRTRIVEASISAQGDSNLANNFLRTEVHPVRLPGEMAYDENAYDVSTTYRTPNRGFAAQFVPPVYPVTVTNVSAFLSGVTSGALDVVIYNDGGPDGSPGNELWRHHVAQSNDTTAVPRDSVVIRSGGFFVAYFLGSQTIGVNNNPNHCYSRRMWEYLNGWGQNKFWDSGDLMIRCSIAQANRAPGAFERVEPQDSEQINILSLPCTFRWSRSTDADGDTIRYLVEVWGHDTQTGLETTLHFVVQDTSLTNDLWPLAPVGRPNVNQVNWSVRATNGVDTIDASNNPGYFFIYVEVSADSHADLLPHEFALRAYPNPFNSTATLSYDVPKASDVELKVFNLVGEVVTVLHEGHVAAGRYRAEWNAGANSSGTYFAVMKAGGTMKVQKVLLLK